MKTSDLRPGIIVYSYIFNDIRKIISIDPFIVAQTLHVKNEFDDTIVGMIAGDTIEYKDWIHFDEWHSLTEHKNREKALKLLGLK